MSAPDNVIGLTGAAELGRGWPAWLLRVPTALACAGMAAVFAAEQTNGFVLLVFGVVSLLAVALPASPAPALVVVGAALLTVINGAEPLRPAALAMIPLAHLVHVCCAIAGMVPVSARLHPVALRGPAVRYVMVQTIVFLVAGVAALVPRGATPVAIEALSMLSLAALALVVAVLIDRPQ